MSGNPINTLLDMAKGAFLLAMSCFVLYMVYPKYTLTLKSGLFIRFNQIAGKVENPDLNKDWKDAQNFYKDKS